MYGKKFVGGGWSDQVNSSQSEQEMVGGSGGEAISFRGSWCEPLRLIPDASTLKSFTVAVYTGTVSSGQRPWYREACETYQHMQLTWHHERSVKGLAGLFQHN